VAGVAIARAGGTAAAVLLAVCGLCTWVLGQVDDANTARAFALLGYATGGVGHVVMLGLLLGGLSLPMLLGRLGPRPLAVVGLVLFAVAELCALALAVEPAQYLQPVARFGGLLWLLATAFVLGRSVSADRGGRRPSP
jgi:hypothetical protein